MDDKIKKDGNKIELTDAQINKIAGKLADIIGFILVGGILAFVAFCMLTGGGDGSVRMPWG